MSALLSAKMLATSRADIVRPVVGRVLQRKCACGGETHGGGECEGCRKRPEGTLLRSAVGDAALGGVPSIVHDVLRERGQPLDSGSRTLMERSFGHDFSGVRVHTGGRAAASAAAVSARAYTVGCDVVMNAGEYRPDSGEGRRLLAHELTHVVQQGHGSVGTAPNVEHEREADAAAHAVEGGKSFPVAGASRVGLARAPATAPAGPAVTPEIRQRLMEELQRIRLQTPFEKTKDGQTQQIPGMAGTIGQHKNRTVAVAAIIKPDGSVTYVPAHFDEGMAEHAEPQLLQKIALQVQQADTVAIAIDQVPCPPGRANCQGALKDFREDPQHGSLHVYTVRALRRDAPPTVTPEHAGPEHIVSPKTAVTRDEEERFLYAEKEFRRVRLPIYVEPAAPQPPSGKTPGVPPKAPDAGEVVPVVAGRSGALRAAVSEIGFGLLITVLAAYIQGKVDEMRMDVMWKAKKPGLDAKLKALWPRILELREQNPNAAIFANLTIEHQYSRVSSAESRGHTMFLDFGPVQVDVSTKPSDGDPEIGKTDYMPGVTVERTIAHVAVKLDVPTDAERQSEAWAAEQREIVERLRRLEQARKAGAPKAQAAPQSEVPGALPMPTRDAGASFIPAPAPRFDFLPGAPSEGPVEQAARFVKNAEIVGQKVSAQGSALVSRLGTDNSPTSAERAAFAHAEEQWRLMLQYYLNWFRERSRDEAVQGIKQLLEDPSRPGPRLVELRSRLGDG